MRLIPRLRTRLGTEHGFSMIIVMGVMAASTLFVAAAFAAANGDLPLTRDSQDRKQSYAAAEAGVNLYQYHLNQDPDYWTKCTNVPAPNGTENQPVNQAWNGTGTDPRRWRNVAGVPTQYTIAKTFGGWDKANVYFDDSTGAITKILSGLHVGS